MKSMHPETISSKMNGAIAKVSELFYDHAEERAEEIGSELNCSMQDSNEDMAQ
jgi:hypothetical protein